MGEWGDFGVGDEWKLFWVFFGRFYGCCLFVCVDYLLINE
jgi:hypothetical protein